MLLFVNCTQNAIERGTADRRNPERDEQAWVPFASSEIEKDQRTNLAVILDSQRTGIFVSETEAFVNFSAVTKRSRQALKRTGSQATANVCISMLLLGRLVVP
jgi:hypothetical protein